MSYVLVRIGDDVLSPMTTVTTALQDAGIPVELWETRNLEWVLHGAEQHIRDLQHFTEALSTLIAALDDRVPRRD
jgi:hypothetical protein